MERFKVAYSFFVFLKKCLANSPAGDPNLGPCIRSASLTGQPGKSLELLISFAEQVL